MGRDAFFVLFFVLFRTLFSPSVSVLSLQNVHIIWQSGRTATLLLTHHLIPPSQVLPIGRASDTKARYTNANDTSLVQTSLPSWYHWPRWTADKGEAMIPLLMVIPFHMIIPCHVMILLPNERQHSAAGLAAYTLSVLFATASVWKEQPLGWHLMSATSSRLLSHLLFIQARYPHGPHMVSNSKRSLWREYTQCVWMKMGKDEDVAQAWGCSTGMGM